MKTEIEKQNARMKQMEASNAELLEALEDCCVIAKPENPDLLLPKLPAFAGWRLRGSKKRGLPYLESNPKERGQG